MSQGKLGPVTFFIFNSLPTIPFRFIEKSLMLFLRNEACSNLSFTGFAHTGHNNAPSCAAHEGIFKRAETSPKLQT